MKYFSTPSLVAFIFLLLVSFSMASVVDDILLIPQTEVAPTIDGELDAVWNSVTATQMLYHEGITVTDPQDTVGVYDDHFSQFRLMWDEDYFYVFLEVVDDSLDGSEKGSPWMSDCFELFFDGMNEKSSSYDDNDIQWRWVYGETPGEEGGASNQVGEWVFLDTEMGYNAELRIPVDTLEANYFPLEIDQEIGFIISNADRDQNEGQQDVSKWWTFEAMTWNDPSLFGTALLVQQDPYAPISDVLLIPFTEDAATIDGEREEAWDVAPEISLTKAENYVLLDTVLFGWTDHLSSAWTMWDEDYFYLFVQVIDDERDGSEKGSPWMSDCVEMFIDGGNEKASSYDDNDVQWRWVYGEAPGDTNGASNQVGEWVFLDTELGYNLELRIPVDTLEAKYFPLEMDQEIGFEVSNADRDNGVGQNDVLHWWTHVGTTWNDPTLFGTALLTRTDAIGTNHAEQPEGFNLGQNYPNPFNPTTRIAYNLDRASNVRLVVYNLLGQQVSVLVDGMQPAGTTTVEFNGENLPSGVYFYTMEANGQVLTNKMMLLK